MISNAKSFRLASNEKSHSSNSTSKRVEFQDAIKRGEFLTYYCSRFSNNTREKFEFSDAIKREPSRVGFLIN